MPLQESAYEVVKVHYRKMTNGFVFPENRGSGGQLRPGFCGVFGVGTGTAEVAVPDDFQAFEGQLDGLLVEAAAVDGTVDQVARVACFRDTAFRLILPKQVRDH